MVYFDMTLIILSALYFKISLLVCKCLWQVLNKEILEFSKRNTNFHSALKYKWYSTSIE
jgi:hypothetical protein